MNRDRDFTADIASNDEPIQLQAQHPRHHHQPIHHHKKPKYSLSIEERHPRERLRSDDEDLDEMDDEDDAMSNDHGKFSSRIVCREHLKTDTFFFLINESETGINMTINSNSINSIPPILKRYAHSIYLLETKIIEFFFIFSYIVHRHRRCHQQPIRQSPIRIRNHHRRIAIKVNIYHFTIDFR